MFSTPNFETKRQLFYSTLERQNRISWSQLGKVIREMTMLDRLRLENIWFREDDSEDNTGDPLRYTDKRSEEKDKQEEKEVGVEMDLQKMTARSVHIHSTRVINIIHHSSFIIHHSCSYSYSFNK